MSLSVNNPEVFNASTGQAGRFKEGFKANSMTQTVVWDGGVKTEVASERFSQNPACPQTAFVDAGQ